MNSRRAFLTSAAALPVCLHTRLAKSAELPVTGAADPNLAPFDKLMTGFVAEHAIPGASLAVTRNGRLVYARGFGYADVENKTPVEPGALFRIASVSKPITGVAVMHLLDAGKIKLDDPVLKYVTL